MNTFGLPAWVVAPNATNEPKRYVPPGTVWLISRDPMGAALVLRYVPRDLNLRLCRDISQAAQSVKTGLPQFVIYYWQPDETETFFAWIKELSRACPPIGVAVVGKFLSLSHQLALRAMGVALVVDDLFKLEKLSTMVKRYFESVPWWSWPDEVLRPFRLPWEGYATVKS